MIRCATGAVTGRAVPMPIGSAPEEFMRRFLLHVLPSGLHRIRHYGLLANASVTSPPHASFCSTPPQRLR